MLKSLKLKNCIIALLGSAILAFGLYNVHSFSGVTEGGVLGLTLLLFNWFSLSPSVSGLILNALCYFIGYKVLGKKFIAYSAVSALGFSVFYALFELFPPLFPEISDYPLLAAVIGALFVGVGVGVAVKAGAAPTGDDALAMAMTDSFKIEIQWVYLISDLTVLALSLTYIPWGKIVYSLLTVVISGQIIGLIQKIKIRI